jgi:hypothetical protein
MNDISDAIEQLYSAFAMDIPSNIAGCPCCITEPELRQLEETPLREISPELLAPYAPSALLTVGSKEDYLYFLPRILEISINDENWWPSIEITARAIAATQIHSWPVSRILALTDFLSASIRYLIDERYYSRIDDWMCAVGRMELDVQPMMALITKDREAVLEFWKANARTLHEGMLGNEFWERRTSQYDEIVEWFNTPEIKGIVGTE